MNGKKKKNIERARYLAAAAEAARAVRERLGLETLATRNSDALDFHDVSVASIRDAIQIAFEAGYAAARKARAIDAAARARRYSTPATAKSALERWTKPGRLMLGDDGKVWLVTPADAAALEAAGYEYAD